MMCHAAHSPGDAFQTAVTLSEAGPVDAAYPIVLTELRQLAARLLDRESPAHTLQPTALVNEAYLRLIGERGVDLRSRSAFFFAAGRAMRQILVDHARTKKAKKRNAGRRHAELHSGLRGPDAGAIDAVIIAEALDRLAEIDPRQCQVVELRFFAGLEIRAIAELLDVSERTVHRDWRIAQAWLRAELE